MIDNVDETNYTAALALLATIQAHEATDNFLRNGEFADHLALSAE
jgi:hypothetical protein